MLLSPGYDPAALVPAELALAGLFDGGWLFEDHSRSPREALPLRLEEAGRNGADGFGRFRAAAESLVLEAEARGGTGAALDALIDGLLLLETVRIPRALEEAERAIDRFTQEVAYKRRDLMPRLPGFLARTRALHREARVLCRDLRWRLMVLRVRTEPTVPDGPMQGRNTDFSRLDAG